MKIDSGKYLSEELIYLSTNPQYDNRLFHELRVQYEKITWSKHVKNMLRTCQKHVKNMSCTQIGLLIWTQIMPRGNFGP